MKYIYLIRIYGKDKTLVKLGYTSDIKARLSQYLYANPLYEVIQTYVVENALQFEQDFHNKYLASFGNEWYEEDLLPTMIKEIEAQVHEIYDLTPPPKITFKDVVIECKKGNREYIALAFEKYDFLEEAIQCLGYESINQCGYNITNVKRKLMQYSPVIQRIEIATLLKTHDTIQEGAFVSSNNLKKILKDIYKSIGITTKAKAADIENYYHVRVKTPRINDKPVAGFVIIKEKI